MCMLIQGFGPFRDNAETLVLCSVILDRKCAPLRDGLIVMLSISPLNFCLFRGCEFFSGTDRIFANKYGEKSSLNNYFMTEFYRGWKASAAIATRCCAALLEKNIFQVTHILRIRRRFDFSVISILTLPICRIRLTNTIS